MSTAMSRPQTSTPRAPQGRAGEALKAGSPEKSVPCALVYRPGKGAIRLFTEAVCCAGPLSLVALERQGVPARLFSDLADEMGLSSARMAEIFRIPRTTLARKIKSRAPLTGREGLATIKMVKLLAHAQQMVDNSTLSLIHI